MKLPVRANSPRRRHLSDEDEALWRSAASTIEPLKRKSRVHAAVGLDAAGPPPTTRQPKPGKKHVGPATAGGHPPVVPTLASTSAPPLAEFDKRHARKIRSGRVEIERRIDLHGMTQREAHSVLRRFLFECQAQGRRAVLVITGKGAPRNRRDDDALSGWADREPGVLKRQVPRWLAEPELRAIVVSYTTAAAQHGGEGALYVHLRRQREG